MGDTGGEGRDGAAGLGRVTLAFFVSFPLAMAAVG